jgi:hypothetical protein
MFSYISAEQRVPMDHPLRAVRGLVDEVLHDMTREFDGLYASVGRPSIPPERLLRAQLLQIFYSIRSERLLMEQLDYNLPVSPVRRDGHGRADLGTDSLHQESRPAAESGQRCCGTSRACGMCLLRSTSRHSPSRKGDINTPLERCSRVKTASSRCRHWIVDGSTSRATRLSESPNEARAIE